MEKILAIKQLHPDAIRILEENEDICFEILNDTSPDNMIKGISDAAAITVRDTPIGADLIKAAPGLKVISRHGVGFDNVDIEACNRHGVAVTVIGDLNAVSVAEHTMFLILSAARAGMMIDMAVRDGDFGIRNRVSTFELSGKTLLIVGYGRIGRRVADRARAFGMNISVHDPMLTMPVHEDLTLYTNLEQALEQADVLTLHVPLTPDTRNMISKRQIGLMPDGALVVNASRGGVIDEMALLDGIRSGKLFGAGLDVFEHEPLPADSPLLGESRIVLSPHSASLTAETLRAMGIKTVENAIDGINGCLDPELVVNREVLTADSQ